ncbi:MAG: DsrE family protein [Acidibacillus sp.]|uniref:DsrE family protein n=1 Tax=Sulfoacidibacillus ferrooxidans TaxID=2005001 RepID=A0A9X1V6J0_9BACL|nr:DsrE family protein [Sulfoacidibacillus ferrooxidans]MCI0182204.1 hypothetical protein [Sulfoacidibacillus ferrooxidans]MCY0893837.1 DsrE family protein [Acidibacillus sp.]
MTAHRVVIQWNESDQTKWPLMVNNIVHLLKAMPEAEIKVISFGPGIFAFHKERAIELPAGVQVGICQNTMRGTNTSEDQLITGIQVVPSGVAEIVKLQADGWIYLRP